MWKVEAKEVELGPWWKLMLRVLQGTQHLSENEVSQFGLADVNAITSKGFFLNDDGRPQSSRGC